MSFGMNWLKEFWAGLRASFWFLPALIVVGAALLAIGMIELDTHVAREMLIKHPRLFGAGADGSRTMLSAVAGSMITVAGVIFSITIVALSQASSQYSPRVLRNFMRDRANQVVLGVFVGIFTYCLIVLRTISGGDEGKFIPSVSVLLGVVLALVGVGFLIFFIHHISSSIQAANVVTVVMNETIKTIDDLFPDELGIGADEASDAELPERAVELEWRPLPARKAGYIQSVVTDALLETAKQHDIVIRMEHGVGEYVIAEAPLVSVASDAGDEVASEIEDAYILSNYRNITQDVAFGIQQLVDVAIKALSPGINDTTTAVLCIERLSSVLARLASRRMESPYRLDEDGNLRVIAPVPTFKDMVDLAFNQIRRSADGNVVIIERLLRALRVIASQTKSPERLDVLSQHLQFISDSASRTIESEEDRSQLARKIERTREYLQASNTEQSAVSATQASG